MINFLKSTVSRNRPKINHGKSGSLSLISGYGSSKKEAKTNAAAKLLGQLYGVKIPYPTSSGVNTEPGTKNPISVVQVIYTGSFR